MLEDVDVVVKAEQNRPIQRLLVLHCIVSVLVMALDMLWTNVLVVAITFLCTGVIIFTLCYTIYVTSSRSRHPASSLRVDRMVELLELYVDVALLGWQDLFIDAINDVRDLEHQRFSAQAIIKAVIFTYAHEHARPTPCHARQPIFDGRASETRLGRGRKFCRPRSVGLVLRPLI